MAGLKEGENPLDVGKPLYQKQIEGWLTSFYAGDPTAFTPPKVHAPRQIPARYFGDYAIVGSFHEGIADNPQLHILRDKAFEEKQKEIDGSLYRIRGRGVALNVSTTADSNFLEVPLAQDVSFTDFPTLFQQAGDLFYPGLQRIFSPGELLALSSLQVSPASGGSMVFPPLSLAERIQTDEDQKLREPFASLADMKSIRALASFHARGTYHTFDLYMENPAYTGDLAYLQVGSMKKNVVSLRAVQWALSLQAPQSEEFIPADQSLFVFQGVNSLLRPEDPLAQTPSPDMYSI